MSNQRTAFAQILPSQSVLARAYRFVRRWPLIPVVIIVLLAVCAVFAPLLSPHDPIVGDLADRNIQPAWYDEGSLTHPLGTDPLGRDLLSRIFFGARISLMVAAIVLGSGAIGGTLVGLVAGYLGGNADEIAMRFVDFTLAVPFILVALVVVIVLGNTLTIIVVLLVVFSWGAFARQVRAETLRLKAMDYVALAKVAGASSYRIMYRHILPGVMNTIIVIATLRVGTVILTESVLSYLGVGVPAPTPAWGAMVSDGRIYLATAWWIAFFPGVAIFLTVLAFNFLGDWLRDKFDPRLRQL
jgi:peptide/nickel transport system permease protein